MTTFDHCSVWSETVLGTDPFQLKKLFCNSNKILICEAKKIIQQ